MHSSFFTSTLCQREAGGFYTVARLEMDRAEISKYNIFAYQKHLHAAATYLDRIGYDPFEDEPSISENELRQTLIEHAACEAA